MFISISFKMWWGRTDIQTSMWGHLSELQVGEGDELQGREVRHSMEENLLLRDSPLSYQEITNWKAVGYNVPEPSEKLTAFLT